jgi:hypothetical protein
LSSGLPANTYISELQTFSSPSFGNAEFLKSFMHEMEKNGTSVSRVIAGADKVPSRMTGKNLFLQNMYSQAGDVVYLMPACNGRPKQVLINPGEHELKLRTSLLDSRDWHHPDQIADVINAQQAKVGIEPALEIPSQLVRSGYFMQP